ncbi:MAG: HDOD domain-containing protein [Planctomycetes bacterium]|nr:HDOD domain-containing protein [Planctomycetota bacterium]
MSQFEARPLGSRVRENAAEKKPGDQERQKILRLDSELIRDITGRLAEIPPLPVVVHQILVELASTESSARSVASIVSTDPVLTASLLRAINSSFYGLQNEVLDIRQAIALLGYDTVQALVMQFGLSRIFDAPRVPGAYDVEDLWVHSLCVSLIAMSLAKKSAGVDRGLVGTVGLLHDVGKLAINSKFGDRVARLFDASADPSKSLLAREVELFGADHAFIGAHVARQWKLPNELIQSIQWHHLPHFAPLDRFEPRLRNSIYLIHVANQISKLCHIYCTDMEIDIVKDEVFAALKLEPSLDDLVDREIKQAITRAIFFVDQITDRPLKAVQCLLGTRTIDQMKDMRISANHPQIQKIVIADLADVASALPGQPWRVDSSVPDPKLSPQDARDVVISADTSENGIHEALASLRCAFDSSGIDKASRFTFNFLAKFVLRNSLPIEEGGGGPVEMRFKVTDSEEFLAFEGRSLAFANVADLAATTRKMGPENLDLRCRALIAIGLGNILTLDWIQGIQIDLFNAVVVFRRPR